MGIQEPQYKSGATVAQRAPIYIDINKDPRARDQAYLNLYSSRVGAPVIAVDSTNGMYVGFSSLQEGISSAGGGSVGANAGQNAGATALDLPQKGNPPSSVTNLKADYLNDDIVITFDWDPNASINQYVYKFKVEIHDSVANSYYYMLSDIGYDPSKFINYSSISQTLTLTSKDIQLTGTDNSTAIDIVGVSVSDIVNNGTYVTINITTPWQSSLPTPVLGSVTNTTDAYSIPISNYTTAKAIGAFDGVIVQENLTSTSDQNSIDPLKWTQAMPAFDAATITGFAPDDAPRWIRAYFYQKNGGLSVASNIVKAEPLSFIPANTNPAVQFTSSTIAWDGNDISIGFVRPSIIPSGQSAAAQVKVKLVPYVNGVESTSLYSYYYHTITDSLDNAFKIKSLDLYSQFGTYYSKFVGYITAVSAQGVETTGSTIKVGPATRTSTLSSVYPTLGTPNSNTPSGVFRVTPISNGYVVDFDLPSGANRLEVYEKSSAWTQIPTDDSLMVFSGLSPATVITPDYNTRYVIVRFYDQYDNTSFYSIETTGQAGGVAVTPLNVGALSLIENPIKIQTNGTIFSGAGNSTTYPQVFFNKDGLFAYDADGHSTTQIINSAASNATTFITKRAVIGDWTISPNGIQNDGYISGDSYTGMSAGQTYAFWAGSHTSLNSDASAKFSVTPAGAVVAKKISIIGSGSGTDNLISAGSNFSVDQSGSLKALNAELSGKLTVNQQSYFNANVNIQSGSYLISAGTGTVKLGSEGLLALTGASPTTKIYSSPITVSGASVSMWSKGALFGSSESSGWLITDGVMKSTHITLDSGNEYIRITGANSANGLKLSYGSGAADAFVIQSGAIDSGAPVFSVTHDGTMTASSATITGTVKSSIIRSASKTGIADGNAGYFFNAAGDVEIKNSGGTMTIANSSMSFITSYTRSSNTNSDYNGASQIILGSGGTQIYALPVQGDTISSGLSILDYSYSHYGNSNGLGPYPRQRMLVEDPLTAQVKVGMAVYYATGNTIPTSGGLVGDLWVVY